jgi:hypothetical protein
MALSEQDYNDSIDKLVLELSNTESEASSSDGESVKYRPLHEIKSALVLMRKEKNRAYPVAATGRNRAYRQLGRRGL